MLRSSNRIGEHPWRIHF